MSDSEFVERLRTDIGASGDAIPARDPVNQPMIRHWCDAMADFNPVYLDPEFAARSIHGEIVAPPAMLNAWGMPGLVPRSELRGASPAARVYAQLDEAGYSSVVATNSEHEYLRYLRLGETLFATSRLSEVSDEKKTGLGIGHFVTTVTDYHTADGERVGQMLFRILKFKPGTGRVAPASGEAAPPRSLRPKPAISRDTAFFWAGVEAGELRIQECAKCGSLHHPPVVRCPEAGCGSYDFGHRKASGRGRIYSFVETHHPRVPSFDYPLLVALIELDEGTRLVSNVVDIAPEDVHIGMEVELHCERRNSEGKLPIFRPARAPRRERTLLADEVEVGTALTPCPIPITPTLIVSTAIASRDYQDVHHDRDLAIQRGSPDIFMNILTTSGLCARYVTDWAGPEAVLKSLRIRLGAPNYPYDTMTMSAAVTRVDDDGSVEVGLQGANQLGKHVTGTVALALPRRD